MDLRTLQYHRDIPLFPEEVVKKIVCCQPHTLVMANFNKCMLGPI